MESSAAVVQSARPIVRLIVAGTVIVIALIFAGVASAAWPGANGKIFFVTYRGSFDAIFSINPDGSNPTFVYRSGREYNRKIEISPNGTRMAFNTGLFVGGNCGDPFGCPLSAVSLGGLAVIGGYAPSSSCPSGDRCSIGPASWLGDDDLVFTQVDGTSATNLKLDLTTGLTTPFSGVLPTDLGRSATSPDARQEVYLAPGPDGSNQVFVANADGSDPVMITSFSTPAPSCTESSCPYNPQEVVWQSIPDTTPPVVTPHVIGTLGSGSWYTSDVTVSWGASDAESNIASTSGCSTTVIASDTPSTTLTCIATNRSALSTSSFVTIKRDATPPTITFTGNAGNYSIANQVTIHCVANDTVSGLASDTCHDVDAPAYTFGVGSTTLSASATDNAGNTARGTTAFTVTATPSSLCNLTDQFVRSSPRYQELSEALRAAADHLTAGICQILGLIPSRPNSHLKAVLVGVYDLRIGILVRQGWLTQSQAAVLEPLANVL